MSFAWRQSLAVAFSVCWFAGAAVAAGASVQLDREDAATADGSVRCGLHNGKIYAILTGTQPNVTLSPDVWSSDTESQSWSFWLSDFDNTLYANWVDAHSGDGQQTVRFRIADGAVQTNAGKYFSPDGNDGSKFIAAVTSSVKKSLAGALPMPVTKNPLKEIRYVATFMCDSTIVPRYGREQLGFMAVLTPTGDNIAVHGRLKDGGAPGIQIISDKEGGTIDVTDSGPFLRLSRAQDAAGK